jgi:hypothetical protein
MSVAFIYKHYTTVELLCGNIKHMTMTTYNNKQQRQQQRQQQHVRFMMSAVQLHQRFFFVNQSFLHRGINSSQS